MYISEHALSVMYVREFVLLPIVHVIVSISKHALFKLWYFRLCLKKVHDTTICKSRSSWIRTAKHYIFHVLFLSKQKNDFLKNVENYFYSCADLFFYKMLRKKKRFCITLESPFIQSFCSVDCQTDFIQCTTAVEVGLKKANNAVKLSQGGNFWAWVSVKSSVGSTCWHGFWWLFTLLHPIRS